VKHNWDFVYRDVTTLGEACRFHLIYSAPNSEKKQGISTSPQTYKKTISAVAMRPNMVDNPTAASEGADPTAALAGAVVGATTGDVSSEQHSSSTSAKEGQNSWAANVLLRVSHTK
jgi:hypothetical protein